MQEITTVGKGFTVVDFDLDELMRSLLVGVDHGRIADRRPVASSPLSWGKRIRDPTSSPIFLCG